MKNKFLPFAIVGAVTAGIVGFVLWEEGKRSERLSAEAPAIGFAATPTEWWDGEDHEKGHTLTFSWLDGASHAHVQTMERITWYDDARTYKVCYNPQDATDWKLYPADHQCGS